MAELKLFIDEDLSPRLVDEGWARGFDSTSCRDRGMLGQSDEAILAVCLNEDRTLVTNNVGDFRALCRREDVHPGLIALPLGSGSQQRQFCAAALDHVEKRAGQEGSSLADFCVNRLILVDDDGQANDFELPY